MTAEEQAAQREHTLGMMAATLMAAREQRLDLVPHGDRERWREAFEATRARECAIDAIRLLRAIREAELPRQVDQREASDG